MAEQLDDKELESLSEMVMANSISVDALAQLLIEKGLITEQEFHSKLRDVMMEYESRGKGDE